MLRPWVVAAAAAVCAAVAFAIPRNPWVDEIVVEGSRRIGQQVESTELTVRVDDRRLVVHAPDGYRIDGWGQGDSNVGIRMSPTAGSGFINVEVASGDGPEAIEMRRGVAVWEVVPGAVVTAYSSDEPVEVLAALLEAIEVA